MTCPACTASPVPGLVCLAPASSEPCGLHADPEQAGTFDRATLEPVPPRPRGRPPRAGERATEPVQVFVTPAELEELRAAAEAAEVPLAAFVRGAALERARG